MSLLITNIYSSIPKFIEHIKNTGNIIFDDISDLSCDRTKKIRLNIKIKLNKVDKDRYQCNRPLTKIISDYNSKNNLKNVLSKSQPTGCNPILSDDNNNIYVLIKDFTILNDVILTKNKSQNLYITYCDEYNPCCNNVIELNKFGTFELISGNPLFTNVLQIDNTCVFTNPLVKSLMNKTVYITIKINEDTAFTLTDNITNINISNNRFNINCNYNNYETPSFLLNDIYHSNDIYILACTITPEEISTYINHKSIPKKGNYIEIMNNIQNNIILTTSKCCIYSIEIIDEIHNNEKIKYKLLNLFDLI